MAFDKKYFLKKVVSQWSISFATFTILKTLKQTKNSYIFSQFIYFLCWNQGVDATSEIFYKSQAKVKNLLKTLSRLKNVLLHTQGQRADYQKNFCARKMTVAAYLFFHKKVETRKQW